MRKKIRSRLASASTDGPSVTAYRPGLPLTDEQARNLRFREDLFGWEGCRRVFASDEERRQAWLDHRDKIIPHTVLGRRCAAFWAYEPDVPDELRWTSPQSDEGESREEQIARHGRLSAARHAWLLAHPGHHRPGERADLQQLVPLPPVGE